MTEIERLERIAYLKGEVEGAHRVQTAILTVLESATAFRFFGLIPWWRVARAVRQTVAQNNDSIKERSALILRGKPIGNRVIGE